MTEYSEAPESVLRLATEIIDRWGLWTPDLMSASAAFARHTPAEQIPLFPERGGAGKLVAVSIKSFSDQENDEIH